MNNPIWNQQYVGRQRATEVDLVAVQVITKYTHCSTLKYDTKSSAGAVAQSAL